MYNWPNGVYSPFAFAPEGVLRSSKGPGGSHGGISEAFGPGSGGFLKGSGGFRAFGLDLLPNQAGSGPGSGGFHKGSGGFRKRGELRRTPKSH